MTVQPAALAVLRGVWQLVRGLECETRDQVQLWRGVWRAHLRTLSFPDSDAALDVGPEDLVELKLHADRQAVSQNPLSQLLELQIIPKRREQDWAAANQIVLAHYSRSPIVALLGSNNESVIARETSSACWGVVVRMPL